MMQDNFSKKDEFDLESPKVNQKLIANRLSQASSTNRGAANKHDFNLDLDRNSVESIDHLKALANPAAMSKM